jgi:hypothetical protein
MRGRGAALAAVAAGLIAATRVNAQDTVFNPVARPLLQRAATPWTTRGFTVSGAPQFGVLLPRESDSVSLTLQPGIRYVVLGICDEDCADLDFHLLDPTGKEVLTDIRSDNRPLVSIVPPAGGAYQLKVSMVKCSTPPCYYALQVMEKAEPSQQTH